MKRILLVSTFAFTGLLTSCASQDKPAPATPAANAPANPCAPGAAANPCAGGAAPAATEGGGAPPATPPQR